MKIYIIKVIVPQQTSLNSYKWGSKIRVTTGKGAVLRRPNFRKTSFFTLPPWTHVASLYEKWVEFNVVLLSNVSCSDRMHSSNSSE